MLACTATLGATVHLAWNPDPDPSTVGYNVYDGLTSGNYTVKIPAGTNTAIAVAGLTPGATYYFAVTAYNQEAESGYSSELVYTVPAFPPMIVSPPVSQTNLVGTTVSFSVTVTGTAPFSYQWWQRGSAMDGATNATLTLANIADADAGTYTVLVSNITGSTASASATLTVVDNEPFSPALAAAMAGQYNGLFYQTNVIGEAAILENTAGMLGDCMVASNRIYSAKIYIGGFGYSLAGQLNLIGNDSRELSRAPQSLSTLAVALHLDWTFGTKQITGTVSNMDSGDPWNATLLADLATNAVPVPAASFLLGIPPAPGAPTNSPGGYGYFMIATTAAGVATVWGFLGDGATTLQSVPISKDGNIPVYSSLYNGRGLLEGWIHLAGDVPTGVVTWINSSTNSSLTYPNGFTNTVKLQSLLF